MRWKQFFTPVETIDQDQAQKLMEEKKEGNYTLLDVRQPAEYEKSHLPGARLIPLPQLKDRLGEIDQEKPTIVYCAVGGRSRVAAQMLAGKHFPRVYNLRGGIKAWQGNYATGNEDKGLELFSGKETPEETLVVAYSLEKGLRDFYRKMTPQVEPLKVKELFQQLSDIEIKHQQRIYHEYCRLTGIKTLMDEFDRNTVVPAMEGGIDTDEYLQRFGADIKSTTDVVEMAMSIEAQALDLYSRAAENSTNQESAKVLQQIADEEQNHLNLLGDLFENL